VAAGSEYARVKSPPTLNATGAVARRQMISRASRYALLLATLSGIAVLLYLGYETVTKGWERLSWDFLTSYPSRFPEKAGLRSSIIGSIWVLTTTIIISIPIAIGTAVWMEEFAPRNRALSIIKLNLATLVH
jgi:phosphate transport system permease protein